MARNIVSIDVGSKNTRVYVGVKTKKYIRVKKTFSFSTPANSVIDGRLEDAPLYKNVMKTAFKINRVKTRNCIFTIQSASVISRDLLLPVTQKDNMEGAVSYAMEQYASVDGKNRLMEYQVVDQVEDDGVTKNKIRVATVPKDMAENYYRLARDLNRTPYVMDLHSNAVAKLFSKELDIGEEKYIPNKAVVVVDFGFKTTHMCIINKGILEFTRLMSYGSNEIDLIMANVYNLPLVEAEQKKIQDIDLIKLEDGEDESGAYHPLQVSLTRLVNELQKVIQYYTSKTANVSIDTMYIHGGGSRLKGLDAYLKNAMNLNMVSRLEHISTPMFRIECPAIELDAGINAIGAMLRI